MEHSMRKPLPSKEKIKLVAEGNDKARASKEYCKVAFLRQVLDYHSRETLMKAVREYDNFTDHNDPIGLRDMGDLEGRLKPIIWFFRYFHKGNEIDASELGPINLEEIERELVITVPFER